MTIRKGEDWGERTLVPTSTPVAKTDASLAALFTVELGPDGELSLSGPKCVVLLPSAASSRDPRTAGNGLASTLGARGSEEAVLGNERTVMPLDLGVATIDAGLPSERDVVVAASLVMCDRFWTGETQGAMNAAFLGHWNVAPGGHPNDGRFDVVVARLGLADRIKARKRLPFGSHIPHPHISIRRLRSADFSPPKSNSVWIDGFSYGSATTVGLRVFPDAVSVAI